MVYLKRGLQDSHFNNYVDTMHNHVTSPVSYETKSGLSLLKMKHIVRGFRDRVLDVFTLYLKMYPALCNYKTEGRM
jgi:hypothetical protein